MNAGLNGHDLTAPPPFDPKDPDDPAHLRLLYGVPADIPDDRVREYVRLARQESEAGRAYETALLRLRGSAAALGAWVPSPTVDRAALAAPPRPSASGAVSIGTLAEPPPRRWTVAGLVPEGAPSILAGHSGLGKSYVALLLSICVCTGRPFLGRDTQRASVLWVDRELDQDEMARRSFAVARGLGMDRPPDTLYYLRPVEPIGSDATQALVLGAVERFGIGLTILDSLTLGALGDAKEQRDVVAVMRHVEAWGTSLSIDHITKSAAAGNHSSATIFGSGMKRAVARSTFFLAPAGDALALRPDQVQLRRGVESRLPPRVAPRRRARPSRGRVRDARHGGRCAPGGRGSCPGSRADVVRAPPAVRVRWRSRRASDAGGRAGGQGEHDPESYLEARRPSREARRQHVLPGRSPVGSGRE